MNGLLSIDSWSGVAVGALIVIIAFERLLPVILKGMFNGKNSKQVGTPVGRSSITDVPHSIDHRDIIEAINDGTVNQERSLAMLDEILANVRDLHSWHDARDADGVLRWMNKESVCTRIETIAKGVDEIKRNMR